MPNAGFTDQFPITPSTPINFAECLIGSPITWHHTGRDGELRLWNMAKGKCSFHTKLTAPAEALAFAPSGAQYALVCGRTVSLHATEGDGSVLQSLEHERKVLCVAYHGDGVILTGVPFRF